MSTGLIPTNKTQLLAEPAYREIDFPSLRLTRSSRIARRIAKWLTIALGVAIVCCIFLPWQQSIRGDGAVVAFDPVSRTQVVQAPVKGVIAEIGVGIAENARVTEGQMVYRITDQDRNYVERLGRIVTNTQAQLDTARQRLERTKDQLKANKQVVVAKQAEVVSHQEAQKEALAAANAYVLMAENKLEATKAGYQEAESILWQAKLDYERKEYLNARQLESGLKYQEAELKFRQANAKLSMADQYVKAATNEVEAKKKDRETKKQDYQGKINKAEGELEKARGDIAKSQAEIAKTNEEINKIMNELAKYETDLARQETQLVVAPRDGYIMRLAAYNDSTIVKQGDPLFTIVPETDKPAVQVWVNGNDAPLIDPGRHVRLQFEGWPAAQFSGWPSVAVGTFGGTVALVDPTDQDDTGRFRVVVVPDPNDDPWPDFPYLRQGARVHGWVLLDQVPLGYEVWRRMNGFPPSLKSKSEKDKPAKPPKIKV